MTTTLSRLKLLAQLKYDPMKALALCEKLIVAFLTILVFFYLLGIFGLVRDLLFGAAGSGTLGFLAVAMKKMYYDNAFSKLELPAEIELSSIESGLLKMGFCKNKSGGFSRKENKFSMLHQCKSEIIHIEPGKDTMRISGPYEGLQNIYKIFCS
ncbi:hypothetical protein D3C76_309170 [compost metagenome]